MSTYFRTRHVGGGCGIKDVVYFLGSCLSGTENEKYEAELLQVYFAQLKKRLDVNGSTIEFLELESEWRKMYPFAIADFMRFLAGWMPTHQKVNGYTQKIVTSVLKDL